MGARARMRSSTGWDEELIATPATARPSLDAGWSQEASWLRSDEWLRDVADGDERVLQMLERVDARKRRWNALYGREAGAWPSPDDAAPAGTGGLIDSDDGGPPSEIETSPRAAAWAATVAAGSRLGDAKTSRAALTA